MEISKVLKAYAQSLPGREQLAVQSFGEAMETVPLTLSENAGLDPIDILSELRARHEKGEKWAGVDVFEGKIKDMRELEVYEPLAVKKQTIKSAAEAATMILRVDDVIASGKMKAPPMRPGGMPGGGYGGMPPEY
jgi:chaperonin GroEL (HSP60 family)